MRIVSIVRMMSVVEKELNKRPNINSMCVPLERREKQMFKACRIITKPKTTFKFQNTHT